MHPLSIVWFRQDLRIEDHPALVAACKRGSVLPVYIREPDDGGSWKLGSASKWWLHHSLASLAKDLKSIGQTLIIRQGNALEVLEQLIAEAGASAVFWSRVYESSSIEREAQIKQKLRAKGVEAQSFNATLLFEPWDVANKQGKPFQVFTFFWKACLTLASPEQPLPVPQHSSNTQPHVATLALRDLDLLPKIPWDNGIKNIWKPGTAAAKLKLSEFLNLETTVKDDKVMQDFELESVLMGADHSQKVKAAPIKSDYGSKDCVTLSSLTAVSRLKGAIQDYQRARDFPSVDGTSHLSPYLHFGEISARMIWHQVLKTYESQNEGAECYLRQLGWREFAHHLLYHFPYTPELPLRKEFMAFPWKENPKFLHAWQKGLTGYPLVDAGMRQLWQTGWMHNRVRMVVGSFLVKDLLISWTAGARWFWDTLVDADLANNTLGWQWVGGCGADAAPYFRVFNPITQSEKFDPEGHYIRQWIPELASLSNEWIHKPWTAPDLILRLAGITLGKTYPFPIVDHAKARLEALEAFSKIRHPDERD